MRSLQTVAGVTIGIAAAVLAALIALPATDANAAGGVATISTERAAALAVNELEAVDGGYRLRQVTYVECDRPDIEEWVYRAGTGRAGSRRTGSWLSPSSEG